MSDADTVLRTPAAVRRAALALGANDCVDAPYDLDELLLRVGAVLRRLVRY